MKRKTKQARASIFDVVALAASAGGHAAIGAVLHGLPADFPTPILVMMHLGLESTGTTEVLGRHLPFPVEWLKQDSALTPGKILVCPPKSFVELLPDGTFVISPNERGAVDKPIDRLFESVARSFGERAIGVILTGMQSDGALGARQLHVAGGRVVVQSESSAEYPDMPRSAIQAGAADLVVPLQDVGQVIADLVAGTPRPRPHSEMEALQQVFGDKGELAARARELDWSQTSLGPVHDWPAQLRELVRLVIEYPNPAQLLWGEEQLMFFNDASISTFGERWVTAFGRLYPAVFPEVPDAAQLHRRVLRGESIRISEQLFAYKHNGRLRDGWFDVTYTPVHSTDGKVLGVYTTWFERTQEVLAARRLETLNQLAAAPVARSPREALEAGLAILQESADISFAIAYLSDASRTQALLVHAVGVEEGEVIAPRQLTIRHDHESWPLAPVLGEGKPVVLEDLAARFGEDLHGNDHRLSESAIIHPLRNQAEGRVIGALILGMNPRLLLDELCREFLKLVGETISSRLAEVHARQLESERLDRLAELDRAKTEFFANISHEFRTPLTLLLAPLEDLLRRREELPVSLVEEVEIAANNSRRLLRLVNSLLDFSQIDTRRQQANFEPTDLCALTTDIASAFRSSIEAAGLRFRVECDSNLQPVWIDRDMWEKIVSNLLSNAFKFTFEGEIAVEIHALSLHAELVVKDTGIGIPEQEMPNLFKRFHRIRGARARTVEGSGIGLSIVNDLVKRLGGQLRARSKEGIGTEFTIWIPYKSARIRGEPTASAESSEAHAFATELARDASRWLVAAGDAETIPAEVMDDLLGFPPPSGDTQQGKILVVDDNADLRNYLQRLLSPRWEVELAADGESALKSAIRTQPEMILADVMMPGLDGFELIQHIREHAQLKHTPVILLTARAGEEAAIQGLLAGADDYIAKPFSPRELIARIQAVIERTRAEEALRKSEEKFRSLFDSIDEGFAIQEVVTDENGNVTDVIYLEVNGAFEQISGMKDVPGKKASELLPHLEQHWLDTQTHIYKTGKPLRGENYSADLGRWITYHFSRIGGAGSPLIGVVFNDVTERKQAELELTRTNELLQATFDNSLQIIQLFKAVRDERGKIVDFEWVMTNKQWNDRWGEMAGKRLLTENPAVIQTGLFEEFKRVTETGVVLTQEHYYNYEQFDGWFLQTVAKVEDGFLLSTLDITERKRRELNLAFLGEVSQDLAHLTNIDETTAALSRKIGEHFNVSRVNFAVINDAADEAIIIHEWHVEDLKDTGGERVYRLGAFISEEFYRSARAGEMLVVRDTRTDRRTTDAAYAEIDTRSFVTAPFVRNGEWQFLISIADSAPRDWQEHEIELLREITNRIWARLERARAEQALRESEEKFRTLFDSIDEGFLVHEIIRDESGQATDLRLREVNRAFTRQTGLGDEQVGKLASEYLPNLERVWVDTLDRVARTGAPERFESFNQATDRWYNVHVSRAGRDDRRVAVVFEDISERKRAEERQAFLLQLSDLLRDQPDEQSIKEQTVRMLGEYLHADRCYISEVFEEQGFSTVGPEQVRPDLPPMTGVYRLSDYPETMRQLATQPMVVHDAATDPRFSDSEKALLAGLPQQALLVAPLRKGPRKVIWALVAAMATPRNWTESERLLLEEVAERTWATVERARVEHALQLQALLLNTVQQSVIATDLQGNIIYWNNYAEELFGWKAEEVLGRNIIGVTTPSKNENAEEIMSELLKGKRWSGEFTLQRRNGTAFPGYVSDAPIYDSEGKITGIVGVAVDITERKRQEQRQAILLKLNDALRPLSDAVDIQRAAMRVVGEFLEVDRTLYNEIRDDGETIHIEDNYTRGDIPKVTGDFPVRMFGSAMDVLRRGEILVIEDQTTTPLKTPLEREASTSLGVFASLTIPLIKEGRWVANFGVLHGSPRKWTQNEIDLLQETAERTWAALERARAEEALRENQEQLRLLNETLEQQVQQKTTKMRQLASEVIRSTQRERQRISQILHDDLQQRVYAVQMQMGFLEDELINERAREEMSGIRTQLQDILQITRHLSIDLSPPILKEEGLTQAIAWLGTRMQDQYGLSIEVQADGAFVIPDDELHVLLFNCVRELLFNVVKHAETRHATVALQWVESGLQIEVHDGGKGFQRKTPEAEGGDIHSPTSLGLATIRHQLSLFGGSMRINSKPGKGAQVTLFVPIPETESKA